MGFFNTLQHKTETEQARLRAAPALAAIDDGGVDLESYGYFLAQAYHHVKHTVPLMMACGARLPERLEFIRAALVEYIDEEYGHQEWILDDIRALGMDAGVVRNGSPDAPVQLMTSYLYERIEHANPLALFGMVFVLEGTSIQLATPMAQRLQRALNLPEQAFHYLLSHGELDKDHFEFFRQLMDKIEDSDDQQAILEAARMCFRLYGDMLHSIPLAHTGQREVA